MEKRDVRTTSVPRREVRILPGRVDGFLRVPAQAAGMVVFAHGSGNSRLSPRNNHVADALYEAGLAPLLFDLLTEEEARDRANVFDIALLGQRLLAATRWLATMDEVARLPVGLFGASTGAAACLAAAAGTPDVRAVVSRGGRPDLAGAALARVTAPTLLIVGSLDRDVLALNPKLQCIKSLEVVPGATHLFEEPGTLDAVVSLTIDWFRTHLRAPFHGGGR